MDLLHYVGRNDFQIKLRGQRIELGEIEVVIMRFSSEITNCVVVKYDHNNLEHLVAYVQTKIHFNVNILRDQCTNQLPLYMVPSLFILIDQFPLNPNGKIDRKALPLPDFSLLSLNVTDIVEHPHTKIQQQVSSIWCQVLHLESIPSINMNFFKLGGNSLLLIKLHHAYQMHFNQSITISDLFRHATIIDHAQFLEDHQITIERQWESFHITQGPASFAQTRLFLDERVRFGVATFDGASIDIFFHDLQQAYSTDRPLSSCALDYIDYSIHEKDINMDEAKTFWKHHLNDFSNQHLTIPYDHSPTDKNILSGRGTTITIQLSAELVDHMLILIQEHEATLSQLGLTTFYTFLFKLTQQTDLCVLTVSANRTRADLENIIGVFVNTIPLRLIIEPHSTFISLMQSVKDLALTTLPYSNLPFQDIASTTNISMLQTLFDVETIQNDEIALDSQILLHPFTSSITDPYSVAKFDLSCSFHYNTQTRSIIVAMNGASDLFETSTIELLIHRFECLLDQLVIKSSSTPVCEFSLLLPHERELVDQFNSGDELLFPLNILPIHEQFACRAVEHPQKVVLVLDDQSLTYAELLQTSQLVADHLMNEYEVQPGDIVGEQLLGKIVKDFFNYLSESCSVINIYAPAECTISALCYKIGGKEHEIPDNVPIGRCLPGRKIRLLDKYRQQVIPDGRSTGEIYLGGIGIFTGYFNNPEENARVLVRLSDNDGHFYRTGDLGRITTEGQLLFAGRIDFQVKLRGQRIELGEIEVVIMRFSSEITNCVVVKYDHNNLEHLVAYVQTKIHFNVNILRDQCTNQLPLYMVPSLFILIDQFPLNPNGKIDRKALPLPDFSLLSLNVTDIVEHPHTKIQQQVSSIWCQVLHLESIPSINMNFFKLGGNSLLLIKLHHAYQMHFNQSITISDLFRHATIIDHAQFLEDHQITIERQWESFHITQGQFCFSMKSSLVI
ncbi:unnamed protein product [Rotaria sp. Silwood1]|nr:unnamed protein product [Rotaria sp. Silwood1]